ncbi:MAG TPA: sigma 54-interacting transcriptional regulator [Candidatus Binatia bacterium]|nr:sigma 54-interacting transcriptional regulator [Candidatus Binatia bacterium]
MNRLYSRFQYRNLGFLPGDPTDVANTVREHKVAVCCLLYVFLIAAVSQLLCSTPALAQDSKNVLVLYGNTAELPWVKIFDASLRSTVKSRSSRNVDFYTEYFDVARFPAAKHREAFLGLLRARYSDRHLDLVVLGGGTAFDFVMSRRTSFFPAVPIVYSFPSPGKVIDQRLPSNVFGVPVDFSPMPTIELALRLHPGTKRLVLVTGAGAWDRAWEKRLRQETSALRDRLQLEFLSGLPTAQLLERLSALPKDTVVFTPGYFNDGAGSVFVPHDSVETLAAKSAAPIYAPYETMVEAGAVGGVIPTFEAIGRQTGDIVADLLDGKSLSLLDLPRVMTGAPLVDWRQVQRWRIDAKLLPANTIVRFKQPSVWEHYGWYVIGALAIIALQALLIIGLLLQRARRCRAEAELHESQKFMELSTGAGELGLWVRDTEKGELWANPRLRSLFGFGQSDVLRFEDLIGRIDPADRARVIAEVKRAEQANGSFEEEFRVMIPGGSERWVAARGRTVDEIGRNGPKRRMGAIFDVTERKRAEQEIRRLKERLEEENLYLREEIYEIKGFDEIVGKSDALRYVLTRAEQVAKTDATVLLLGETGVGKELIARAIHEKSSRSNGPQVKVNCATLPEALVESELFGHEKGAFTGADRQRKGRFELADGGTILLDEVGELPAVTQAKLLRVLQEGEFERLGGSTTIKVNVRVIAATNRELSQEVSAGRFRQDLFYRLNVYPITIPPLRERTDDIPLLVSHYAREIGERLGKKITEVPAQVLHDFIEYNWPGNIRELQNVIERAVIVSTDGILRLREPLVQATTAPTSKGETSNESPPTSSLEAVEREHILRALEGTGWRIQGPKGAAALLKLHPSTLRFRMKKLGLTKALSYRPRQANKSTLH